MGNTTELERESVATDEKPEESGEHMSKEPGSQGMNKGEGRVVERLRRAKAVATLAAPELEPTLEDLVEIAELIEDEGG